MPSFFTVAGTVDGQIASVVWSDGELTGTPDAVARIREAIEDGDEVFQTPTGPVFRAALQPPEIALLTILQVFDDDPELEGVISPVPATDVPKGATP